MLIKVCGMREPDNIRRVAEVGADWMGFIFYARSPRFAGNLSPYEISKERAVRKPPVRVGVFVDATPEYMMEMGNNMRWGICSCMGMNRRTPAMRCKNGAMQSSKLFPLQMKRI